MTQNQDFMNKKGKFGPLNILEIIIGIILFCTGLYFLVNSISDNTALEIIRSVLSVLSIAMGGALVVEGLGLFGDNTREDKINSLERGVDRK